MSTRRRHACYCCGHALPAQAACLYGLHTNCFLTWFGLKEPSQFISIRQEDTLTAASARPMRQALWNSSFFHGKFRKYSATLGANHYILKVKQAEAPELPQVEFVCNQIARLLKLPVPKFFLIDFYNEAAFVSENFVKPGRAVNLVHIYHYLKPSGKYDCESLLRVIHDQTHSYHDLDIFVRMCLFDALIGNHDRHGRNIGFLNKAGKVLLAPVYDNPCALGLEHGRILQAQFEPKGKIAAGDNPEPSLKDYSREFKRLGHHDSVAMFVRLLDLKKIRQLIKAAFCSKLMQRALAALIERRYAKIREDL
jgi:hypothetical protein